MNRAFLVAATTVAIILALPESLEGQQLSGSVVDGVTESVIEGARISLLHPDGYAVGDSVISSASGEFRLPVPGAGSYYVMVERIGYTSIVDGVLSFESTEGSLEITVYLLPEPVEVEGVDVDAALGEARYRRVLRGQGFYQRVAEGLGDFITPEEIEERGAVGNLSDLLRGIPGITLYHSLILFRSQGASATLVRELGEDEFQSIGRCEPTIWIDGSKQPFASSPLVGVDPLYRPDLPPQARLLRDSDLEQGVNEWLGPEQILAIEVYRSAATTPLRWGDLGSACGTIVIWTKIGE